MNQSLRLKLRKGKENSQGRQLKTQYRPKQKQTIGKNNIGTIFDSTQLSKYTDRSKPIQLKFIPMRGLQIAKKLTTQPYNTKRLNKSQKYAAEKIFQHEPIKKKVDRQIQEMIIARQHLGKDRYIVQTQIGNGTFGTVYQARDKKTLETVAIKKVFQDKKYKNRQLEILKVINHPNILKMKDSFFTFQSDKEYLNVVMEHFSSNLYQIMLKNNRKIQIPKIAMKLMAYQLIRGLLYLQMEGIAHRDIKPQNVLVNQSNWKLVICDFGSAKKLKKGQPNIAYICSRSYRAPELIFGCTEYSTQIDMWSAGCVLAQLITVEPLFRAKSSSQHLVEVIKVFGTPTQRQILQMNPKCDVNQFKFPKISPKDLSKVLGNHSFGQQFNNLLKQMFKYNPSQRLTPFKALSHPFFDELRQESVYSKIKREYGIQLFNFYETKQMQKKNINELIPKWYK